jgi:hypothetical protein
MSKIVQFILSNLLIVIGEFVGKLLGHIMNYFEKKKEEKEIQKISDLLKEKDYKKRMEAAKRADDLLTKK